MSTPASGARTSAWVALQGQAALAFTLLLLGIACWPSEAQNVTASGFLPSIPYYNRSEPYSLVLPEQYRRMGVAYVGNEARLRSAIHKLVTGKNITVAAVGGSITQGQGGHNGLAWPYYVRNWMNETFKPPPESFNFHNGGVGGTVSHYMSTCHSLHVPKDADLIFVEYAVNDAAFPTPAFDNAPRRSFERLLRKLLRYPRQPAVVLVNSYAWMIDKGRYWMSAESQFFEFATYYQLPLLSVKACCYHLMARGVPGFDITATVHERPELEGKAFYYDNIHPDGDTGGRVLAELAMQLVNQTAEALARGGAAAAAWAAAPPPELLAVPPPMLPDNWESPTDSCLIGNNFVAAVTEHSGFEWVNEDPKHTRPKWGWVAKAVGSRLGITINTTAAGQKDKQGDIQIELLYLQSYEHMGTASINCTSGCTCQGATLDGHTTHKSSQLHVIDFRVSQADACVITVTVLNGTSSGEHKVKVAGIVTSEVPGVEGIRNSGALWYVHDISMRGKDGKFEVMNHARR